MAGAAEVINADLVAVDVAAAHGFDMGMAVDAVQGQLTQGKLDGGRVIVQQA